MNADPTQDSLHLAFSGATNCYLDCFLHTYSNHQQVHIFYQMTKPLETNCPAFARTGKFTSKHWKGEKFGRIIRENFLGNEV